MFGGLWICLLELFILTERLLLCVFFFPVNVLMSRVPISQMFPIIKVENKRRRGRMFNYAIHFTLRKYLLKFPSHKCRRRYYHGVISNAMRMKRLFLKQPADTWKHIRNRFNLLPKYGNYLLSRQVTSNFYF